MTATSGLRENRWLKGWRMGLFWGWNAIFLAFFLLGFAPTILPELISSVRRGVTPLIYLIYCLVLIAILLVTTIIAALFLRKDSQRLFALGYVVEWPLLLILLFRFFLIREGNPAITVLLVWLAIAEAVFLWFLLDRKNEERRSFWIYLRLAGLMLLFSGTIYAAVWLLFYVPPIAVWVYQLVRGFILNWGYMLINTPSSRWFDIPLAILGMLLLFFSGTLIVIMPVTAPILAGQAWLRSLRCSLKIGGRPKTLVVSAVPLALVLAILGVAMVQPQKQAFQLLDTPPANPQQAQFLLKHEQQIRVGLVNAYLASFRYLSSVDEVRHIREMYQYTLMIPDSVAWRFEQAYEIVIRPFLYVPVQPVGPSSINGQAFVSDQQKAADLYLQFFDQPIIQGERREIVRAVRASPDGNQAELAWQAVDDREVHLNAQDVELNEHGDWAEIQIHEAYENRTWQRQEVVYYFSLPETAVITGLWLGNTADRSQAFAYQVIPRGAAQAVYRNEVRYNRDPALVEQIGPRQYRLRAFPLEPQRFPMGSEQPRPGPELHVWMTYRTMSQDGGWPLPRLAEKRNVYWDAQTERSINGEPAQASEIVWLPDMLQPSQPIQPVSHQVDFPGGQTVLAYPAIEGKIVAVPENLRMAVVLDRSFSMREHAGDVKQALADLAQMVKSGPEPDIILTSSKFRGESPGRVGLASLDPDQVIYFGGQNAAELLAQFQDLQAGKPYDVILVLTDDTGYELSNGNIQIRVPDAPVWVVHLGEGFPLGYDDTTQQAIQASGGGVARTVSEALARYIASRDAPGRIDVVDGYAWQTLPTGQASAQAGTLTVGLGSKPGEDGFAALAARRNILAEMAKNHGKLNQNPILDQLNQLAVDYHIVTPYSSMLVLVNDTQQQLLDRLLKNDDRYQREVENVGETTQANPLAITGVPEPEEWLLLILAGLLLGYAGWRKMAGKANTPIRPA